MASNTRVTSVVLKGGLNLATPILELSPGECTQLHNYEVSTLGRYTRIQGYDRFDGRLAPSDVPKVNDATKTDQQNLAQWVANREAQRALIQPVPGEGKILGVAVFKGEVYAFRNNVGSTAANMYQSTVNGWQLITTPTLAPNGRYEFRVANFTGNSATIELVGVDGVNKAFRYDGITFSQIDTGMEALIPARYPEHLEITSSQILFLSYGSSIMYSGVGDPTKWVAPNGGEIAVSDRIIGLDTQANNSLAVFCRNTTYVLYGKTDLSWELTTLSSTTGAIEWAIQTIGDSIYLDDRGLTRLNRVQSFGNFDMASISQKIDPLLSRYTNRVVSSFVIKEKNQYRLCFDDGSGMIVTFRGAEVAGFSTFDYNLVVRCTVSAEDKNGKEVIYFGSDDGFIYQTEVGTSFDGNAYASASRPAFTAFGQVEYKKKYKKTVVEVTTPTEATLQITPDFDYSDPNIPAHQTITINATGGGGYYDEGLWDEMRWSSASVFTADLYMDGIARNISLFTYSNSDREPPHSINSFIYHWQQKGRRR